MTRVGEAPGAAPFIGTVLWYHFVMRRKHAKTLEAIYVRPVSANIHWHEIEALFVELGAEVSEREGSRIAVVLFGEVRVFHRPTPVRVPIGGCRQYSQVAGATWGNAMNIMMLDGYQAKIEYDAEMDLFRGEILGLNGGADFYGRDPAELREEFRKSLAVFLDVCREKGIEPRRHYSGKFNLRISPELHEQVAVVAQAQGKSINTLAQEALQRMVG